MILNTTITLGYVVPWRLVHETLIKAALVTSNIQETSLDDYYVSYELNAYTNLPSDMAKIYSDLHQNIQDKFNEAGIEILSPHYQCRPGWQSLNHSGRVSAQGLPGASISCKCSQGEINYQVHL